MTMQFVKATKKRSKLRLAIDGPSGSGKTYTALTAATAIADGGKIAVLDTERGSASLYSDKFSFDVLELDTFSPQLYIDAIEAAEQAGYSVIVIDSLSHAWEGEGGALDMVDRATQASVAKNSYYAWKNVTPLQRKLVDAMLQSKAHIIATMRSKTEYVEAEVTRNGRAMKEYRKVGTAPVQRAGIEYEFTIFVDMDLDHNLVVSKTRFDKWGDNKVEHKPSVKFFAELVDWLNSGAPETVEQPTVTTPDSAAKVEEPAKQAAAPATNHAKRLLIKIQDRSWPKDWIDKIKDATGANPYHIGPVLEMIGATDEWNDDAAIGAATVYLTARNESKDQETALAEASAYLSGVDETA